MSVTQRWVRKLPWKMQSILFSGLRGPDTGLHPAIKNVSKWMRAVSQENADPTKGYMNGISLPQVEDLEKELEFCAAHYVHHFADALRVIAYGHPERQVRQTAFVYHLYVAEELFHFLPEHPEVFAWRHRDKKDGVDAKPEKPWDDREWTHAAAGRRAEDGHP